MATQENNTATAQATHVDRFCISLLPVRGLAARRIAGLAAPVASHAAQFDLHKKYQPGDPYNPDRFVDSQGFRASVERLEKVYREQLAKEQQAK